MIDRWFNISSGNKTIRMALLLVWLSALVSVAFAEKMETTIQEAIYIFEMKGESAEAIKMLE